MNRVYWIVSTPSGVPCSPAAPRVRPSARSVAVAAALLLGACGDSGGLASAGATPTASGPARLWPGEPPASSPAYDYGEAETEVVEGVKAPGEDIHKVDPVAVVRAEIAAHPEMYSGSGAPYAGTASRMTDCGEGGDRARCPVLKAYYRDLTGDGRDDMVLGFRLLPGNQTAVRMYTFQADRLVQVWPATTRCSRSSWPAVP